MQWFSLLENKDSKMTAVIKLLGAQLSIANANTVANSNLVRVYNSGTAAILSLGPNNSVITSNCTLAQYESITLEKLPTDCVTGTGMLAVPIAYRN